MDLFQNSMLCLCLITTSVLFFFDRTYTHRDTQYIIPFFSLFSSIPSDDNVVWCVLFTSPLPFVNRATRHDSILNLKEKKLQIKQRLEHQNIVKETIKQKLNVETRTL